MDEEDLQEAEESRTLQTSNDFAGFGTQEDSMRRSAAIELFRPSEQTRGVKLLMRMGWKEGQGIGPRVRRAADLGNGSDEAGDQHLFAPADANVVSYFRKTDRKGLGYEGELQETTNVVERSKGGTRISRPAESSDEDDAGPRLLKGKKSATQRPKTGFGVGVLNDEDADDDDPYSMGPRISYNRVIGGDKKSKGKLKPTIGTANPMLKTKPTFISKKLSSLKGALRKCHDGRLPPDGFALADELDSFSTMSINDEKYRPQPVPSDWKSSISPDTNEPDPTFTSTADAAKASTMTSKTRAALLGESPLPGKSIFDFMTPAARDRLAAASGRENLPPAKGEHVPTGDENHASAANSVNALIPKLEQDVALQALNRGVGGWMPYAEDESKRERYRAYLEIQAGLLQGQDGNEIPPKAEGMRQEDWVLEMQEFARAAHVFKPISGLMASRFTSSTAIPQSQNGEGSDSLLSRPAAKPEDPAEAAAKLGMFGPMTRSFSNFYPTRLVCKRFSLPPPEHAAQPASTSGGDGPPRSSSEASSMQFKSFASAGFQQDPSSEASHPQQSRGDAELESAKPATDSHGVPEAFALMDPDRNEALEQDRPGLAVFKAIFGSDDEDD
jgi:G patch domain-containing protein 1